MTVRSILNAMKFHCALIVLCSPVLFQAPTSDFSEARALYLKVDFTGAVHQYRLIIEKAPKSEEAYVGLIRSLWKEDAITPYR